MKTLCKTVLMLLAATGVTACGPSFTATTPPGFVELENDYDEYDYRATTADGLVTSVREIDHDPEGSPEFWLKAIKNRMRERGGYALLEEVKVTSSDGVPGTQLRFGHDEESGKPHLYYVTLFVTDKTLFVLEAGGTKELMTQGKAQLDAAVSGFSTQ
jgi:hypothetical protein